VRAVPLAEVRDLFKSYRRGAETVAALDGVSLELLAGELVAVVGPSGSGKTTLLNVLAGWEAPDRGAVLWEGHEARMAELDWATLSVVPQRLGLLDELSLRENVALPLRLRAGPHDRAMDVDELLGMLGLGELGDRPPSETSLGEQQRAARARPRVLGPRMLLADEPAGHQDAASAEAVFAALRTAASRGACCVVATHNRDTLRLCDRALQMLDGRVDGLAVDAPTASRG
jgi:putative ABC transport system ATP-binding protein